MRVLIRGAGDLATGIAYIYYKNGYDVLMTERSVPLTVRRQVAMSSVVYGEKTVVQGVEGRLVKNIEEVWSCQRQGFIAVIVDEEADIRKLYKPDVLVDAILAKRNVGTNITDAPFVIGVGPGFTAGEDCHCVIETQRGDTLGHVIWSGTALANTGIPGEVAGYTIERLLRAPADGMICPIAQIGDIVEKGQTVAYVGNVPVYAAMSGQIRGMLQEGVQVTKGLKIGDIDARLDSVYVNSISDKALLVGEGAMRATFQREQSYAFVVLAAGMSRRFAGNKLQALLDGKELYKYTVQRVKAYAEIPKIIVTNQSAIEEDTRKQEFLVVHNPNSEMGISSSIQLGLRMCEKVFPRVRSAMFMVCDQPYMSDETIERLLVMAQKEPEKIICPSWGENYGNPVIWPHAYWEELKALQGDVGGKRVLKKHLDEVITVEVTEEELRDIDVREDM